MKSKLIIATAVLTMILPAAAFSQKINKEISNAAKTAASATRVLDQIMAISDSQIPADLLKKAKAVAVFPNVVKAAFIFGGQGGKGLIIRRVRGGWDAPALFKIGGGSVGLQIGGSSTDVVMLFMTDNSLKNLLEDKFEIGGEASAAAGPVGRTAKASTDAQLQAQILSYSRSKGLFAGISLSGAVISADNDANRALYAMPASDLLTGAQKFTPAKIPAAVRPFHNAVGRYAK